MSIILISAYISLYLQYERSSFKDVLSIESFLCVGVLAPVAVSHGGGTHPEAHPHHPHVLRHLPHYRPGQNLNVVSSMMMKILVVTRPAKRHEWCKIVWKFGPKKKQNNKENF